MDLEAIRQFVAGAQSKTFLEAAAHCNVSTSTLTRGVQRLERELGVSLFDRTGRRVALNDAGKTMLPHARRILEEEDAMRREADAQRRGQRSLTVGSCSPAPLWRLVPALCEEEPELAMSPRGNLTQETLERELLEGGLDLAILPAKPTSPSIAHTRLMCETLYVSLPQDHPLARLEEIDLEQLDGETFLIQAGAGYWQRLVRDALPHSEFKTAGDYILTASLMSSSPLPHFATDRSLESVRDAPGHVLRRLADPDARVTYELAWLASRAMRLSRWVGVARRVSEAER